MPLEESGVFPAVGHARAGSASAGSASGGEHTGPIPLAVRIAAGEAAAEAELVEQFGRPVSLLLARHTRGRPEAEDLFQDTFALAVEKLRRGELRDPAALPKFLSQLARNLTIEHYRKGARRRTEADSETVARAAGAAAAEQIDGVLRSERADLVRRMIRELNSRRDREILFRYYVVEEDRETIAADFGLTADQFSRVLHRARLRYKALVAGQRQELEAGWTALLLGIVLMVATARWTLTSWTSLP